MIDIAHLSLLSFASLGFAHVEHDLPYSEVASTLQIELSHVEKWTIGVISTGLKSFWEALTNYPISTRLPLLVSANCDSGPNNRAGGCY
ncbi:hypothetical protein BDR03DRAFT_944278 [Suillus americanus]|nr:hypothetical protein BDR03DRAFT_944278 [Suillus americanus]